MARRYRPLLDPAPGRLVGWADGDHPRRRRGRTDDRAKTTRREGVVLKRADLYSSLGKSCDELRGGMDASQYKDYILTLLFVKYVTDKATSAPNSLIDVPKGGSFDDMLALKGDKAIGEKINKIISRL